MTQTMRFLRMLIVQSRRGTILVLSAALAGSTISASSPTYRKPSAEPASGPATVARLQGPPPSKGPAFGLRLVSDQALATTSIVLTPSSIADSETLSAAAPTFDVVVGPDSNRSIVLLAASQSFNWHQVVSTVPLSVSVGMLVTLNSSALPSPGPIGLLSMFADGEQASAGFPSLIDTVHSQSWEPQYAVDVDILKVDLGFQYKNLTDDELTSLAKQVLTSDMEFTLTPTATVRSVSNVTFGRIHGLQVWAY